MLILGCGNSDRGDDAAGLLVVRGLLQSGIAAEEFAGDGIALMGRWEGLDYVVVVDAVSGGKPPGTVSIWDETTCNPDTARFCSTHAFGLGEALRLGKTLGRLPRRLLIYGIEGASFAHGSPPCPQVLDAVARVQAAIASLK